jgi:hypothetical protein
VANATSVTNAADNGVVTAVFQATTAGLTITASSMALEVVWPKFGDLAAPAEYAVRYKADATGVSDVVGSISVPTANITQAFTGTFMANITGLIDGVSYRVWVFRSSDTYTIATPLYTGTGSPVASSTVTLESTKSHGTAGANSITGLATSAKYVVKQENLWHPIGANGNLGNGGTLDAAVSATVSNVAAIRNLNNDNTYNVFLVKAFADDNATLGTADTGGKNTIADVKALTAPKTFTITSTGGGGTLIVFTNELNATAIAEKTINETDQIGSAAKRYRVTEATNVSTTKIKAATTDRYAEIDLTPMQEGSVIVFTVQ